ncbi:MAG: hypothetical protein QOF48_1660 [Verrucomicrobiota bacterium]
MTRSRSTRGNVAIIETPEAAGSGRLTPVWRVKRTNVIEVSTNRVDAARFHWSSLETNDFEVYVANLRGVGCPEYTVRHLVSGEIEALYAVRVAAAEKPGPFWETPKQRRAREVAMHREQASIVQEKRAILKRLLGMDWSAKAEREWVTDDHACLILGFLPDEKAMRLMDVAMGLETVTRAFRDETGGIVIDTDEVRLEALVQGAQRELEYGLSPEEVQEGTLRGIHLARSFMERNSLTGVTLNGDELRRMMAATARGKNFIAAGLRSELDANRHGEHQDIEDIMTETSPEAEREIRAMLGEQRFASYERSKDEAFREFAGVAKRLEVPLESTVKAYEVRRAAETAARDLNSNSEMAPEQRRAALNTMRRETELAITAAVGAEAAKEFFRDDRGWARAAFGPKEAKR